MISKKTCKNDTTFSYTGKESSPLGLGYCASAEQVGSMMLGRDQTMWMVGLKNGVKVWNRVPTEIAAVAAPLEKEAPVLGDAQAAAEPEKAEEAPVAKKKAAAPKKKAVAKKSDAQDAKEAGTEVPERKEEDSNTGLDKDNGEEGKEVVDGVMEKTVAEVAAEAVEVPKPKAKKRVTKKKVDSVKNDDPKDGSDKESAPQKEAPPKPKQLTKFNMYMSYRMKMLAIEEPNMAHKEKFGRAAAEWKSMDDAAKSHAVELALASKEEV